MKITDREFEVLKMVAVGKSHREIAKRMGVCTRTVATYQCNLGKKINAHNAVQIAHFALHLRLVKNLFAKEQP